MNKISAILVGLLCFSLVATWISPATAIATRYVVNVLVAYDEEWEYTARWAYWYSPEFLAKLIMCEVYIYFDEFHINFAIVDYVSWDSYDNPETANETLDEVSTETGFYTGMTWEGSKVHWLIAFTGQDIPGAWGIVHSHKGEILVQEHCESALGWGQLTDNILQHEISHLYLAKNHYSHRVCTMDVYNWYKTNEWCDSCHETIRLNMGRWGTYYSGGGSGGDGDGLFDIV